MQILILRNLKLWHLFKNFFENNPLYGMQEGIYTKLHYPEGAHDAC